MARLDSFLRLVTEQQASDLHFCAGSFPSIRHDGDLIHLPFRKLKEAETRQFLFELLEPEQKRRFEETRELDFVYEIDEVARFRANYFVQARGLGAVFRVIPNDIPTLDDLSMPPVVRTLASLPNGLVLVTGPTGAGKTTTLAAIIDEINATSARHLITIEDPVEFIHLPKKGVVTQRQVGKHTESFASALRSALRESPDVLVVGEMRDMETITLALSAAETGALVFGTLHTNSAAAAIDRMVDAMPEESRDQTRGVLSVLLRGVVAQHLVKRATGEGRVAVMEVLLQNYAVSHLIREGKTHQINALLRSTDGMGNGMMSLDSCLLAYIKQGLIPLEEALRVARAPDKLKSLAAQLPEEL